MKEAKYTKGPWCAEFGEAYRVRSKDDGGQIAIMMNLKGAHGLGGRRTGDEVAANARLISAAPDLLEALQEIVDAADGSGWAQLDATLANARAAIAKALGN